MRPPPCGIKAVLVDMDGVLFLSSPHHEKAFRQVFRSVRLPSVDYRRIAGMKTAEALRVVFKLHRRRIGASLIARLARQKHVLALQSLSRRPPVHWRAMRFLRTIARELPVALVSSAGRSTVDLFLRAGRARRLFRVVVSGDDVRDSKPSPEIYKLALRRLHIRAGEAIAVEDSVSGVRAAVRAGIKTVGLKRGESALALKRAGARQVIRQLDHLRLHE